MQKISLKTIWPDFSAWHTKATTSTMKDARELAHTGTRNGVVVADWQSAGRGRLDGRSWESAAGQSLLCTVWMSLDDVSGREVAACAPLVAGAALVRAIRDTVPANLGRQAELRIKWPNDVLADGRKLAGILCERADPTIYAGIGVNMNQTQFEGEFRGRPASILQAFGRSIDRYEFLEAMLAWLWAFMSGTDDWFPAVSEHLAWKNKPVRFSPGCADDQGLDAELLDIDRSGALLLKRGGLVERVYSGELKPGSGSCDDSAAYAAK